MAGKLYKTDTVHQAQKETQHLDKFYLQDELKFQEKFQSNAQELYQKMR